MKVPYLNWAFFWFLVLIVLVIIGLFIANQFVGTEYQFFGPGSRRWAAGKIQHAMETCPPNHVRIIWFRRPPFTDQEMRELDLAGKTLAYGGMSETPGWIESWGTAISVNHCGINKLSDRQLVKFETILNAMPNSTAHQPVEESLSVAINRKGKLLIYHYQFDGEESFASVPAPIAHLWLGGNWPDSSINAN